MDKMKDYLETKLLAILGKHPWFMAALDAVSDLGLPHWCIGAGVIRNIVFDFIDGGSTTPIRDQELENWGSERKQMKEALRQSEEYYRTLIQKIQTAVVIHGPDTRILTCNPIQAVV